MKYRFRTGWRGAQVLQISDGPQKILSTDPDGTPDGRFHMIELWRDANRWEAESFLMEAHNENVIRAKEEETANIFDEDNLLTIIDRIK